MKKLRYCLAQLIWIVPLVAWMTCGVIVYNHENDHIAKGECLKTYTLEHWHKHSAPTYTTHTVMLYGNKAYIVDGTCETGVVSWKDTHRFIYAVGVCSIILWFGLGLGVVALIGVLLFTLYCYILPDKEKKDGKSN